ncbi:MAG: hypothetical protein AB7I50_19220 [Vicinamibacterales bacterium]
MQARILLSAAVLTLAGIAQPALAQVELSGNYIAVMHEDYIERGPGSFMGDFTGMPLNDDGRAKALLYTSNQPSTNERQCLAQSGGVFQYRPVGIRIWNEQDQDGRIRAWVIGGDNLRGDIRIWMDGRKHPSANAQHIEGGFATGRWEGDTLVVRMTHLKTAWIRRGVGIPGSDQTTIDMWMTKRDTLLTITTIQEDPNYLTEPHVVSRIFEWNPRAAGGGRPTCNTGNEIPSIEDTDIVPHYMPGQNPEEDYMVRVFNLPKEAAMGYAETLYPEYRKKLKGTYKMPTACSTRAPGYCCGWIETQGLPGGAPNLTCNDGGFGVLGPRGRQQAEEGKK